MEIQRHKKERIQVVKKLTVIFLITLLSSCYSQKNNNGKEKSYTITKYTSKDRFSCYLNIETYEFENRSKRFYSIYQINNLIFTDHDINSLNLNVLHGEFRIKAGAVSKQWLDLPKLTIKKGDSITIKVFLKNEVTPLE